MYETGNEQLYAAGVILDENPWFNAPRPVQEPVRSLLDFTSTIPPDCLSVNGSYFIQESKAISRCTDLYTNDQNVTRMAS